MALPPHNKLIMNTFPADRLDVFQFHTVNLISKSYFNHNYSLFRFILKTCDSFNILIQDKIILKHQHGPFNGNYNFRDYFFKFRAIMASA